jgi:hypothetical protein
MDIGGLGLLGEEVEAKCTRRSSSVGFGGGVSRSMDGDRGKSDPGIVEGGGGFKTPRRTGEVDGGDSSSGSTCSSGESLLC